MSATELSIVIQSLLTLVVLAFVVFWFWPEQRTDLFRQQMFALRDELWDFAVDGNIAFDDPAYTLLRQLMNGFIRYAHNLTPYRILMSFLRWKYTSAGPVGQWTASWHAAVSQLPNENTKETLQKFHSRATDLVLGQILLSPGVLTVCMMLAPILVITVVLHTQWTNLKSIYRDVTNRIPLSYIEEEAART
jgi:cbb3-type cytochrome oxidase subunit 3